jgi:hypothetical protein
MYLTEEEAREKYCPNIAIAMMIGKDGKPLWGEEGRHAPDYCNCIASECMMWTWEYKNDGPMPSMTNQPMPNKVKTGKGGCGLARQRGLI